MNERSITDALGALRHPDQSVAHLNPRGLTLVAADCPDVRAVAVAIERSLAWGTPVLYAEPAPGSEIGSVAFVRVEHADGDLAADPATVALRERIDAARAVLPRAVRQLVERIRQTSASLVSADQRRQELKDALGEHAATLAGDPRARAVVGYHRRIAHLELERRALNRVDVDDLRRAYEHLTRVDPTSLPVDPDAQRLADAWEQLLEDEAELDAVETRDPLADELLALQAKLRSAEAALAAERAEVDRPRPTAAEREEIERLHKIAEGAVERAERFGSRKRDTEVLAQARDEEAALLQRFGFTNYPDYLIGGAMDTSIAALARFHIASEQVEAILATIKDVEDRMAATPARQSLLARTDELAVEIFDRFGEIDPSEDVAALLRGVRLPPPEWFCLIEALEARGHEPTDDPLQVAQGVLHRAEQENAPIDALDAQIADVRSHLAALDGSTNARFGPLGSAAAELVHLEAVTERLTGQLVEARATLDAELDEDPTLEPRVDELRQADQALDEHGRPRGDAGGRGADVTAGQPSPAHRLEAAVAGLLEDNAGPAVVTFEVQVDHSPTSVSEMERCMELFVDLSADRQLVVVTAVEVAIDAARTNGRVRMSTFGPATA